MVNPVFVRWRKNQEGPLGWVPNDTQGLLARAPERPCQAIDPRIEGGAQHGPIARPPGIVGRDEPIDVEVGIVPRLADIGTERGDAVLVQVLPERLPDSGTGEFNL
jgi:hypothetical protein